MTDLPDAECKHPNHGNPDHDCGPFMSAADLPDAVVEAAAEKLHGLRDGPLSDFALARLVLAAASGPWAEQLDAAKPRYDYEILGNHDADFLQLQADFDAQNDALAAALARNAELQAQRDAEQEMHAQDCAENSRLRAELDNLRGKCICNTGPGTDGPDETCPVHGRSYAEWIERGDILQTKLDRVTALADDLTNQGAAAELPQDFARLRVAERLRAIVRGSDDE